MTSIFCSYLFLYKLPLRWQHLIMEKIISGDNNRNHNQVLILMSQNLDKNCKDIYIKYFLKKEKNNLNLNLNFRNFQNFDNSQTTTLPPDYNSVPNYSTNSFYDPNAYTSNIYSNEKGFNSGVGGSSEFDDEPPLLEGKKE